VLLLDRGLKIVLVMEFVQVGVVFTWVFQVGVVKLGSLSRGVQVGVLLISRFPFFYGVSLSTTSR
jgi:hypothetical protein